MDKSSGSPPMNSTAGFPESGDRRAENLNAELLDLAFEPIFVRRLDGTITYWNKGAAELYGYSKEEAEGANCHTLLKTVLPIPQEDFEEELARHGKWIGELLQIAKHGRKLIVESRHQVFEQANGSPLVLESIRDITERETQYRMIFEGMQEGVALCLMLYDEQGQPNDWIYLDANPALEQILGIEGLVGMRGSEVYPCLKESCPELLELYGNVAQTGMPATFEGRLGPLDKWVFISAFSPLKHHIIAIGRDITPRKRAEEALRESEQNLRLALDSAGMGMWDWNLTTDELKWDERLYELFGIRPEEFSGHATQIIERIHPDDREATRAAIARGLSGAEPFLTEFRVTHPDGTVHWVAGRGQRVANTSGDMQRMVGVNYEITERKLAEHERDKYTRLENLAQMHRMHIAGEFAALLAHQLNQPLTAIRSFAEAGIAQLRRGKFEPLEMRQTLEDVVAQSERAAGSIRDLRKFLARQPQEKSTGDLNAEVRAASTLMDVLARGRNIQFKLDLEEPLPPVSMRPSQIEQVIINLMENAMDSIALSSKTGGLIQINTRFDPIKKEVVAEVLDSGPGLENETVTRVFDPLYTTKKNGIGMGLVISRSVIQDHGGRIWAEAGPGGRFIFTLPTLQ